MKGKVRPISAGRRMIVDMVWASAPLVTIERTMKLDRLVAARGSLAVRPSWAAIVTKAFCIVARDEPDLRTFHLKWPLPHFYEVPESVAIIAVTRDSPEKDAIVFFKIGSADDLMLPEIQDRIQNAKSAPLDRLPFLQRQLRIAGWPLPLRRLMWLVALNIGRQRANYFGTVAITSIASSGSETVALRSPGPNVISYGMVNPDHTMKLLFHWDHRVYDGVLAARVLQRMEDVLNEIIADELLASRARGVAPAKTMMACSSALNA